MPDACEKHGTILWGEVACPECDLEECTHEHLHWLRECVDRLDDAFTAHQETQQHLQAAWRVLAKMGCFRAARQLAALARTLIETERDPLVACIETAYLQTRAWPVHETIDAEEALTEFCTAEVRDGLIAPQKEPIP